jgi:hypothetical protein
MSNDELISPHFDLLEGYCQKQLEKIDATLEERPKF